MPEPRSAVMILVQATWEDQHGTLQTARACMENRSPSGACIRVPARIAAGTKLKIQWRWEEFNGVAKYCRTDGQEYLVGVQRIAAVVPRGAAATTTKTIAPPPRKHNHAAASATTANETLQTAQPPTFASPTHAQIKISAVAAEHDKPQTQIPTELPAALKKSENETHTAAPATLAAPPETLAAASAPDTRTSTQQHNTPRHDFDALFHEATPTQHRLIARALGKKGKLCDANGWNSHRGATRKTLRMAATDTRPRTSPHRDRATVPTIRVSAVWKRGQQWIRKTQTQTTAQQTSRPN
jgi:hypothetical protein